MKLYTVLAVVVNRDKFKKKLTSYFLDESFTMTTSSAKTTKEARAMLIEWSSGHIRARALHCAAILRIADYIKQGIGNITDLADHIDADAASLYRLLRLLASYDIFKEEDSGNFSLTDLAVPLLSDHPNSLRAWLAYHDGDTARWEAYGHMLESVKTGLSAFELLYDQHYFDFIKEDPVRAREFDEGMTNLSQNEEELIAHSYDFSAYKNIVDCGGGLGGQLAKILQVHEGVRGSLYELKQVINRAADGPLSSISQERYNLLAGSFFDLIPAGADLYILKRVLHDWHDEACQVILRNCAQVMTKKSRLLIIEAVLTPKNERDFLKDVDLAMLVLFGGKERSRDEWENIVAPAGLRIEQVIKTESMLSLLEICLCD